MSFFENAFWRRRPPVFDDAPCRKQPPGPESAEATARLARQHPSPWDLDIDHAAYAKDPGTPLEWLLQLAERYPDRIALNKSFRLHLALSPERFRSASTLCQLQLLKQWDIGPELIRLLASTKSSKAMFRVAAAENPRCPEDLLWAYLDHNALVRRALRNNPRVPSDLLRELDRQEWERQVRSTSRILPECPFEPVGPVSWSGHWRRRFVHRLRGSL
jgi:hypothetical protein